MGRWSREPDRRKRSRSREFIRDSRRRRSRSPERKRKRSRSRSREKSPYSRRDYYPRKRSRERRDKSPKVEDIVGGEVNLEKFDKDEQQKKLEIVMQQRREKVEKWRQEQAKKKGIDLLSEAPIENEILKAEDESKKKWSLEDEFDDNDEEEDGYNVDTTEVDDSKLILPKKKEDEENDLTNNKIFKAKMLNMKFSNFNSQNENQEVTKLKSQNDNVKIEHKIVVKKQTSKIEHVQKVEKIEKKELEDEIDPLDLFMEGIQKEMKKTRGNITKKEEKIINDKKISVLTGIAKKANNVNTHNKKKGELLEQNQDALEYSSEDEGTSTEDLQSMNNNLINAKQKKLTTISKDEITFMPFEKKFYVEVPELAKMTPEEVDELREELEGIKVKGKGCPKPIKSWAQAGVSKKIFDALKKHGYEKPTPIQAQAIPAIMSGRDLIGIAKTGSGKTLAFLIPMFRHILAQPELESGDGPVAIILTPTRELATQITLECRKFAKLVGLRVVAVYGGTPISEQIGELKPGAEIVVCTPGRMIDMLAANNGRVTNVRRCTYLVLDEADRMFDMGFEPQVNRIIDGIRPDRQTVMFSATFPRIMESLARRILTKPIEVSVGGRSIVCKDIEQNICIIEEEEKFRKLLELLGKYLDVEGQKSAIVFVDKQENADMLLKELMHARYTCLALHGGIDQTDRDSTISDFKANKVSVLVATSVAARGLDVKHCIVVVNYDCPNHYEDYVHRCGRTGRAGNKGYAWTLITPDQGRYSLDINKALELSGYPINEELTNLFNTYKARQEALGRTVKASGSSGFSGKGFKFNEQEAQLVNEKRKFQKVALGLQDSDDEDPEADINQEIENMLAPKKPKINAVINNLNATLSAMTNNDKMEMVKRAASKINFSLAGKATSNTEAFLKGETNIIQLSAADTAKSLAERRAEALHAKLNYIPKENDENTEFGIEDAAAEGFQRFEEELEINDFPQQARWRVTSKEAIAQIAEYSEAGITVRGTYVPPGSKINSDFGERKLYLAIEGTSEWAVSRAKNEIIRLIKEELSKLQSSNQPANKGRYKVL